jgi:hypothetical protein
MSEIPEALRLAYALKERHGANSFEDDAATELRRQHAEIERLKADNEALRREAERLREALKHYGKHDDDCGDHDAYNNESLRHCGCGLDAVLDDALTASTAPASASKEPATEPAIRAQEQEDKR